MSATPALVRGVVVVALVASSFLGLGAAISLAAGDPTGLTDGSGLVGAATSAGIFSGFLFWFAKSYLPSKDQQMEKILADHRAQCERIQERADAAQASQRADHQQMMTLMQESCQKELTALGTALGGALASEIREELGTVNGSVRTLTQAIQAVFQESARRAEQLAEQQKRGS